jgi:thiamine biosynthesis protein ThiS
MVAMTDGVDTKTAQVNITLNGEARSVPAGLSVAGLIAHLELPTRGVAVEKERTVVRRSQWGETAIDDGDRLEIIHFVGGG